MNPFPFIFLGLFTCASSFLFAQPEVDGVQEIRVVEITKQFGHESDVITDLEVSSRLATVAAGIPSTVAISSGRVVYLSKRNGKLGVKYDFLDLRPPAAFEVNTLEYTILNQGLVQIPLSPSAIPSFGQEVALSENGNVLVVSAPDPINEFERGLVFVYNLRGFNVGVDDPNDLEPVVFGGPLFDNPGPDFPNFIGSIREFGKDVQVNGLGRTISVSGVFAPANLVSNKGVVYFIRPQAGGGSNSFEAGAVFLPASTLLDYTVPDGFGEDISMTDPGAGEVLIGVPNFEDSQFEPLNPGGGGIAIGARYGDDTSQILIDNLYAAPGIFNAPNNGFGSSVEISGNTESIMISMDPQGNSLLPPSVFFFEVNPDDGVLVTPASSRLTPGGGASSPNFGASLSFSKDGSWAVVGDPDGGGQGVGHLYDVLALDKDPTPASAPANGPIASITPSLIAAFPQDEPLAERHYQVNGQDRVGDDFIDFQRINTAVGPAQKFAGNTGINRDGIRFAFSAETIFEAGLFFPDRAGQTVNSHLVIILDAEAYLPVELTSFTAQAIDAGNELRWETATETKNLGFTVQRSHNAQEWENIGWMDGYGNTTTPKSYTFLDDKPYNGLNYYRLEQEDFNGWTEFSDVVSVNRAVSLEDLNVYPNPFKDILNVVTPVNMPVTLVVYDSNGRKLYQQVYQDGNKQLPLANLASGTYLLEIRNGEEIIHSQKVIKGQ